MVGSFLVHGGRARRTALRFVVTLALLVASVSVVQSQSSDAAAPPLSTKQTRMTGPHKLVVKLRGDRLGQRVRVKIKGVRGKAKGYRASKETKRRAVFRNMPRGRYVVKASKVQSQVGSARAKRATVRVRKSKVKKKVKVRYRTVYQLADEVEKAPASEPLVGDPGSGKSIRILNTSDIYEKFTTAGGPYTWTVPTGVTNVLITAVGGGGAGGSTSTGNSGGAGGAGAVVTTNQPVSAGDDLQIYVGEAGSAGNSSGFGGEGYNEGGDGQDIGNTITGGGGGGSSAVILGDVASSPDVFIVAGGGGGGGSNNVAGTPNDGGDGGYNNLAAGGDGHEQGTSNVAALDGKGGDAGSGGAGGSADTFGIQNGYDWDDGSDPGKGGVGQTRPASPAGGAGGGGGYGGGGGSDGVNGATITGGGGAGGSRISTNAAALPTMTPALQAYAPSETTISQYGQAGAGGTTGSLNGTSGTDGFVSISVLGAPSDISTDADSGTISVSWQASSFNESGSSITDYVAGALSSASAIKTTRGCRPKPANLSNDPITCTISGLSSGTYYIRMRAKVDGEWGDYSVPVETVLG